MANYGKIQNAMSAIKNAVDSDNNPMPDSLQTIPIEGKKLLDGIELSPNCNMVYLTFRGAVKLRFDGKSDMTENDPYHNFDAYDNPPFGLDLAKNIFVKPNGEAPVQIVISQFSY